jgi:hypothetical protein
MIRLRISSRQNEQQIRTVRAQPYGVQTVEAQRQRACG